jgi:hypothetical protein
MLGVRVETMRCVSLLLLLLAPSSVLSQEIRTVIPGSLGTAVVEYEAPWGRRFTVQSSTNGLDWMSVLPNEVGSGEPQYREFNLGPRGFFRVQTVNNAALKKAVTWDLSELIPGVGVAMLDTERRYFAMETKEQRADSSWRRNAGLHLTFPGGWALVRVSENGFPSEVYISDAVLIKIMEVDESRKLVRWRAFNVAGEPLLDERTTAVPADFFERSLAAPSHRDNAPPSINTQLIFTAKAGIGLVNLAATNVDEIKNISQARALIAATTLSFIKDTTGQSHFLIDASVWGVNAMQCGSLIVGGVATGPVSVPAWFFLGSQLAGGGTACLDTIIPIIEIYLDVESGVQDVFLLSDAIGRQIRLLTGLVAFREEDRWGIWYPITEQRIYTDYSRAITLLRYMGNVITTSMLPEDDRKLALLFFDESRESLVNALKLERERAEHKMTDIQVGIPGMIQSVADYRMMCAEDSYWCADAYFWEQSLIAHHEAVEVFRDIIFRLSILEQAVLGVKAF